ncbi:phospholipase A2 [Streptomyces gardneri]|uniref:phospholipase A2 n=1 Tax=Streptomyces gardneri TaxID=66892 RepID=UPI0019BEEC5F|nr:phospholipase A2 [Streptomyces gardneri]GHH20667.1 hypothetical protein GCM10017674_74680 [Streptomyces gardneri]
MSVALLLPQQSSAAIQVSAPATEVPEQPAAAGEIGPIGPGTYESAPDQYRIIENDVPSGLMTRSHLVTGEGAGAAQALDAPANRPDLGVFGPSWTAEFLGGQLNRELTHGSGAITTTDLGVDESVRYGLTWSMDRPDGGSLSTYTAPDGSTLVESSIWDDAAGELRTTITETANIDLATAPEGDDVPVNALGEPIPAADLKPTLVWKQVNGSGSTWRVTSVGTEAFGKSTAEYDAQGRVRQVDEPARGDYEAQSVRVTYASATTAAGSTLGDVAGQVKEITTSSGATVQTQARYAYDHTGLLRRVTNPAADVELNTYAYDANERLSVATTDEGARWELTYAGETAAPQATETTGTLPEPGGEAPGAPSQNEPEGQAPAAEDFLGSEIEDPFAYPANCNTSGSWMYYSGSGCSTKVAHYGWKNPSWKTTKAGWKVRGIDHDHCTTSPDKPGGYDFRPACDSHDYGYGTVGNAYKGYRYYLDKNKGLQVDATFWNQTYNGVCRGYFWKGACRLAANVYLGAVMVVGRVKSGANAT